MNKRLLSWNVNGIRAVEKKGFIEWLLQESPFLLAVQETKAWPEQLSVGLRNPQGFYTYWSLASRKGYSGVGLFSRERPLWVGYGFDNIHTDCEGRILVAEYADFILLNIYFPNGKMNAQRLAYKLFFYEVFLQYLHTLRTKKKPIVICADVNTAHTEIDLARPKENVRISGFLPQERAWIDRFIDEGFIDTFRVFHKGGGCYTWWDPLTRARERNVGWRIDYFFMNKESIPLLKDAFILDKVQGSDHCPIGIEIS